MKKVCVLMSTYNGEKYLEIQLKSILEQENVDVLLYVRDDGSKDSTIDILKRYKSNYKNIEIIQGKNVGVKRSFFELLKLAPKSEFYAFADQDDFWKPNKLCNGVKKLIENNNHLLYFSKKTLVDSNLKILSDKDEDIVHTNLGATLMRGFASGCTMIFKDKLKNEVVSFNIDNFSMHDTLLLKVASCFPKGIVYDSMESMLYRQHANNVVGSIVLKKDFLVNKIFKFLKNKNFQKTRRFESAQELYDKYNKVLTTKEKENLLLFIKAKEDYIARVKLCCKSFLLGQTFKETFIFKCRLLLGML